MLAVRQRRFVRVMALLVLLAAILPNVTYFGHWNFRGLSSAAAEASADGHANHCHGTPSCADQAAVGPQSLIDAGSVPVLAGGPERALSRDGSPSPLDTVVPPPDHPPQYA